MDSYPAVCLLLGELWSFVVFKALVCFIRVVTATRAELFVAVPRRPPSVCGPCSLQWEPLWHSSCWWFAFSLFFISRWRFMNFIELLKEPAFCFTYFLCRFSVCNFIDFYLYSYCVILLFDLGLVCSPFPGFLRRDLSLQIGGHSSPRNSLSGRL